MKLVVSAVLQSNDKALVWASITADDSYQFLCHVNFDYKLSHSNKVQYL